MRLFFVVVAILPLCLCIEDWHPVLEHELYHKPSYPSLVAHRYQPIGLGHEEGQCANYKVGFTQDLYFQYIQYKTHVPEMKEFTLCMWHKFFNHTNDHPLFSYAVDEQPRAIYSWISNTDRSSYYSLAVEGHTFYRLNYPLRLNRWYHTCQSWNGRTGEWQIWVNAERVGRGFHNRLVGHVVPGGGIAITGQEQTQTGGGFIEGKDAPKGSGGMLGEVTMVQLYSVALTAGKAHKDHKHHHAHKYDKNGVPITTTPSPTPAPRPNQPTHPLLTGGQLNPNVALNIAAQQPVPLPVPVQGQNFNAQLLNGQFFGNLVSQQLTQQAQPQQTQFAQYRPPQRLQLVPSDIAYSQQSISTRGSPIINSGLVHPSLVNPANVQIIDNSQLDTHSLFKRHNTDEVVPSKNVVKRNSNSKENNVNDKQVNERVLVKRESTDDSTKSKLVVKRDSTNTNRGNVKFINTQTDEEVVPKKQAATTKVVTSRGSVKSTDAKLQKKRELYFPSENFYESTSTNSDDFEQSLLDGLAGIGQNEPVLKKQKQSDEREPAEAEVKAVMNVCSGCDEEPFAKALVFGWRSVPKKLYSGAFYQPAVPECRVF